MDAYEFLQEVPLFSRLSHKHLHGLAKACTQRTYQAGDILVHQGNPGVGLFIITAGRVRIVKTSEEGERFEIAEHGPSEVIGELSVLDGAPRTADVVAVEDTTCLVLASWAFNSFMQSHPEVALEILPVVVKRFRETNEALMSQHAQQQSS